MSSRQPKKQNNKLVPLQENNTNYSRTNHFEMSEIPWTVKGPFLLLQADAHSICNRHNPHRIETYAKHKTPEKGHMNHYKRHEAPENQEGIYKYS